VGTLAATKHSILPTGYVVVRSASPDDTERVLHCANEMMNTSPYVLTAAGEFAMTHEQERAFLLASMEHPRQLFLVADVSDAPDGIVGLCSLTQNTAKRKTRHRVTLGMGMRPAFRGKRVGTALMHEAVAWAIAHPELHMMLLAVYAKNEAGLRLYRAHGFVEWGRLPAGLMEDDGSTSEQVEMVRWVGPVR
jgi:RimJ/RimL family protein N-acetyltransferase